MSWMATQPACSEGTTGPNAAGVDEGENKSSHCAPPSLELRVHLRGEEEDVKDITGVREPGILGPGPAPWKQI